MRDQPRDRLIMPSHIPMPKAINTAVKGLRSMLASISPLAERARLRASPAVFAILSLASPTASETPAPAASSDVATVC